MRYERKVPVLLKALDDPDNEVVCQALGSLLQSVRPKMLPKLTALAASQVHTDRQPLPASASLPQTHLPAGEARRRPIFS